MTSATRNHITVDPDTGLVQGVSQAQRMDFTIQKATELGVSRIVPVITNRSVARPGGERASRRLRHWVAVAARSASADDDVPVLCYVQMVNEEPIIPDLEKLEDMLIDSVTTE